MAENKNKKEKSSFGNMRSMNKAPKINPYWIYGVVIVVFLAIQWFTMGAGPVETNWKDVNTTMLPNNDVKKIVVVNEKEAQIYLKESSYDKYEMALLPQQKPALIFSSR
jgi:AFG3 family protein